jgi:integrase
VSEQSQPADSVANLSSVWQALGEIGRQLQIFATLSRDNPVPSVVPPPWPHEGASLADAVNQLLVAKARAGRGDRYLRQLRCSLAAFVRGRGRRPLEAITAGEIESWLMARDLAARTRANTLKDLRLLFAWAQRRGYVRTNPALGVELPQPPPAGAPGIHSPDEVRRVLEVARRHDPQVCRLLAVRYFAGVRSAEALRLREHDFRPGLLEVPAAKAKTRARRLVTIQPALAAWLALGETLGPMRVDRVRQVVRAAGVLWPHNVTRHTFCSYHLAAFGSAAGTALEAGHSEAMLFRHYRALATPTEAAAFWAIQPG